LKGILNNPFIESKIKDIFFEKFAVLQTNYWRLNRFVFLYKIKKMPLRTNNDLYMNPILETDKNVMTIFENDQKYLFTCTDIYKIVFSAITQSHQLFSCPIPVKNPYNNLPFSKASLYNIYFFLKRKLIVMHSLIHQFFLCDFDLIDFERKNIVLLRNEIIEQYVNSSEDINQKYLHIMNMFKTMQYSNKIKIHPEFPKDKLVKIMHPYLRLYMFSCCSLDKYMSISMEEELKDRLDEFYHFNPSFGRKIITSNSSTFQLDFLPKKKGSFFFNEHHIEFLPFNN
jgi:hypothetical protein